MHVPHPLTPNRGGIFHSDPLLFRRSSQIRALGSAVPLSISLGSCTAITVIPFTALALHVAVV